MNGDFTPPRRPRSQRSLAAPRGGCYLRENGASSPESSGAQALHSALSNSARSTTWKPSRFAAKASRSSRQTISKLSGRPSAAMKAAASCRASAARSWCTRKNRLAERRMKETFEGHEGGAVPESHRVPRRSFRRASRMPGPVRTLGRGRSNRWVFAGAWARRRMPCRSKRSTRPCGASLSSARTGTRRATGRPWSQHRLSVANSVDERAEMILGLREGSPLHLASLASFRRDSQLYKWTGDCWFRNPPSRPTFVVRAAWASIAARRWVRVVLSTGLPVPVGR